MEMFECAKGCCQIKVKPYVSSENSSIRARRKKKKAGVLIYDPEQDKVLIVQSRGKLWGLPKGTLQYGETERLCAIREVKEETGLEISDKDFAKVAKIRNRAIYFYLERQVCELDVQDHIPDNDANVIGWVKPSCLVNLIKSGNMDLNYDCRTAFKIFRNINIPPKADNFTTVSKSRKNNTYQEKCRS